MDRYEDDVIFDVADIHNGQIRRRGSFEFLKYMQDGDEKYNTDHRALERYLYIKNVLHVQQLRLNPPCYQISKQFQGMKTLIDRLGMLPDPFARFYSKLIAGGDYAWALDKRKYDRYQKYTVEVFGLKTGESLNDSYERTRIPDPRQYATRPQYWYESSTDLIQIWRTRVFLSSSYTSSITNPLTPYSPIFPYVEKRWHPHRKQGTLLFERPDGPGPVVNLRSGFYEDACKILVRSPATPGRGRSYKSLEEFYREVRTIYRQLAQKEYRPGQKEVMLRMRCSEATFYRYWEQTKLSWKKSHDLFMSEVIPPEN
ncbi:MAG TPA: hypothetical protein VGO56_04245 [Pyrinomonadaceae bacterium]|jgi:hypothetical protein|nr:hypothetical protein [Pyrinomonadaceae bacterium]